MFGSKGHGGLYTFNRNDGYLEALIRGYRAGLLSQSDYANLVQCDALEDMKLHLAQTDYGDFLANEPSPLYTTTIAAKCLDKLVDQFNHVRIQAVQVLIIISLYYSSSHHRVHIYYE